MKLIDKDAVVAEIEKQGTIQPQLSWFTDKLIQIINDSVEVKEVDLELITYWFDHIAQIADDRKTANGTVMEDWAALDEIKCLAKNSSEFIKRHYKAQKGE